MSTNNQDTDNKPTSHDEHNYTFLEQMRRYKYGKISELEFEEVITTHYTPKTEQQAAVQAARVEVADEVYKRLQFGKEGEVWKYLEQFVPAAKPQTNSSKAGYEENPDAR
jgi:hypothetical protein